LLLNNNSVCDNSSVIGYHADDMANMAFVTGLDTEYCHFSFSKVCAR